MVIAIFLPGERFNKATMPFVFEFRTPFPSCRSYMICTETAPSLKLHFDRSILISVLVPDVRELLGQLGLGKADAKYNNTRVSVYFTIEKYNQYQ